jgi:predicted nucleic acid-binding Zn ribbon protein
MSRDRVEPWALRDLLEPVSKRVGLDSGIDSGLVWARWAEIVGPEIANHAEPTSLRQGVLRVRTESPTWATEIGYLAEALKQRVNETLGRPVVKEVRVWTGPGAIREATKPRSRETHDAPPTQSERSDLDDPREAFQRAYVAWRTRREKSLRRGPAEGREIKESPW